VVDRPLRRCRPFVRTGSRADPIGRPLIAVKVHIFTRNVCGGLETDLDHRVLKADVTPSPGCTLPARLPAVGGLVACRFRALEERFGRPAFSVVPAGRGAASDSHSSYTKESRVFPRQPLPVAGHLAEPPLCRCRGRLGDDALVIGHACRRHGRR